jgi:hypothetical protein
MKIKEDENYAYSRCENKYTKKCNSVYKINKKTFQVLETPHSGACRLFEARKHAQKFNKNTRHSADEANNFEELKFFSLNVLEDVNKISISTQESLSDIKSKIILNRFAKRSKHH